VRTVQRPIATIFLAVITAASSIAALRDPALLASLQRHPDAAYSWHSWHLLSPLLVHSDWALLAFNLAGLVIVGTAAERRFGSVVLVALYLVGGLVGELAGIRWQPVGAGNSVATFAIVGALMTTLVGIQAIAPSFSALFAAEWTLVYAALEIFGVNGAIVAGMLCAPLSAVVARMRARAQAHRALGLSLAGGTLALAVLLCVRRDIHGPPLIAGALGVKLLRPFES
jgi:membrane associated rhomboid family serine protease